MPIGREAVHQALECLNDNVLLAQTALLSCYPRAADAASLDERAARLRTLLLDSIEVLRPPHRLAFGSPASRHYDVLSLRYVSSMTVSQVAAELSLGRRQVHRDLLEAEAKLAEVLSASPGVEADLEGNATETTLRQELAALPKEEEPVRLSEAMAECMELVRPLAQRFGVGELHLAPTGAPSTVTGDPAAIHQLLVQTLSSIIKLAHGGVQVAITEDERHLVTRIHSLTVAARSVPERFADVGDMAAAQGVQLDYRTGAKGSIEVSLRFPRVRPPIVLVVEDNSSAIEMYQRYLSTEDWEVHGVPDPRQAREAAIQLQPDIILLDIMMPKLDGWSVLSLLATDPETQDIPVVVCSVVQDPELSEALGAAAFLKKPVSQEALLGTLRSCLRGQAR